TRGPHAGAGRRRPVPWQGRPARQRRPTPHRGPTRHVHGARRRRGGRARAGDRAADGSALLSLLMVSANLLLLADSRLPSGGHAHSGGLEAAVAARRVRDLDGLAGFLRGRLATTGLVAAAFAAAATACAAPMIGTTSGKLWPQAGPETTTSGKLCRS